MGATGGAAEPFVVGRDMALELGNWGSGVGKRFGGGSGGASRGGGECDGREDGGDMEVMSTDGERTRGTEELEDGEGESSGAGGGGSTNSNVRDTICICDLACRESEQTGDASGQTGDAPLAEWHTAAST